MATITDFLCNDENGREIHCDAFGNNVAVQCPNCGHPILAILRPNHRVCASTRSSMCAFGKHLAFLKNATRR